MKNVIPHQLPHLCLWLLLTEGINTWIEKPPSGCGMPSPSCKYPVSRNVGVETLLMRVLKHLCSSLLAMAGSQFHTLCVVTFSPSPHALSVALAAWTVESVSKCRGPPGGSEGPGCAAGCRAVLRAQCWLLGMSAPPFWGQAAVGHPEHRAACSCGCSPSGRCLGACRVAERCEDAMPNPRGFLRPVFFF